MHGNTISESFWKQSIEATDRHQQIIHGHLQQEDLTDEREHERLERIPEDEVVAEARIKGKTSMLDAAYLSRAIEAAQSVGCIRLQDSLGREHGAGTGILVSPRLMLTAGHVLPTYEAAVLASVWFSYERDVDGIPTSPKIFRFSPDVLFHHNSHLDFTLVAIEEIAHDATLLSEFGFTLLVTDPITVGRHEALTVVQHFGGGYKQVGLRSHSLIGLTDSHLRYTVDNQPASSGAAVFNDQFELVGLQHAAVMNRSDHGTILTKGDRDWEPSHGVDAVHWLCNEAVQTVAISAAILDAEWDEEEIDIVEELFEYQFDDEEDDLIDLDDEAAEDEMALDPTFELDESEVEETHEGEAAIEPPPLADHGHHEAPPAEHHEEGHPAEEVAMAGTLMAGGYIASEVAHHHEEVPPVTHLEEGHHEEVPPVAHLEEGHHEEVPPVAHLEEGHHEEVPPVAHLEEGHHEEVPPIPDHEDHHEPQDHSHTVEPVDDLNHHSETADHDDHHQEGDTSHQEVEAPVRSQPSAPALDLSQLIDGSVYESYGQQVGALRPETYVSLRGFLEHFLPTQVKLPRMLPSSKPLIARTHSNVEVLDYTHFSIVMNSRRKLPFFVAFNADGKSHVTVPGTNVWLFDNRIDRDHQPSPDFYFGDDLNRTCFAAMELISWGDDAARASTDAGHYTNTTPQNRRLESGVWSQLESQLLASDHNSLKKISVFAGPIFGESDPIVRGIRVPLDFWKLICFAPIDGGLSAVAFRLSQGGEGHGAIYQLQVQELERETGLDFGDLKAHDTLRVRGQNARVDIQELSDIVTTTHEG